MLIARLTTCHDLAKNEADLKKIGELFITHQASITPAALLLSWFPSPARKANEDATTQLFAIVYAYVEKRRHAKFTSDAIDIMIAEGDTTQKIVAVCFFSPIVVENTGPDPQQYVITLFFAGAVTTGIHCESQPEVQFVSKSLTTHNKACWALIYLAIHSEWRERCKQEIQDLIHRYPDDSLPSATLHEKLKAIPISAWEDELPTLDACIQELQRIRMFNVTPRRHLGGDMKIGGHVVRRGDFLLYPVAEVHFNPEYYPEPHKYDPGRWLRPDLVPTAAYPFLGWGAGRHPCAGMKAAKLEMKLILAVFLTRYEYKLVDKDGKFPNPLPVPNRNENHQVCVENVLFWRSLSLSPSV